MMNNEKKKEDIKQMTDKHLDFLLNNYSGIGVIIEKKYGSILRYFYQILNRLQMELKEQGSRFVLYWIKEFIEKLFM